METIGKAGVVRCTEAAGDNKLLELINALLTTTGGGPPSQRPQPMGLPNFPVNRFVARNV
jgi:hypothetical protein